MAETMMRVRWGTSRGIGACLSIPLCPLQGDCSTALSVLSYAAKQSSQMCKIVLCVTSVTSEKSVRVGSG